MKKKQRRTQFRDHRKDGYSGRRVPVNEHVTQASLEDVLRAMERFSGDLDWSVLAPNVVPLFPRRRPMPAVGEPLAVMLPPGIMTRFGIDAGPAVMHIGADALARWSIDMGELTARALENLRVRTAGCGPRDLVRDSVDGVAIRALQSGQGVASALLLVPDELIRIFGDRQQSFVAPMRDLLVSVSGNVDPGYLAWLHDEFASLDPNALAVDAFTLEDGRLRLEPLGREVAMA